MNFTQISENCFLFEDYANVYVVKKEKKAILIDFGSGEILNFLPEIGIDGIEYIFHTHYHRDQSFGDQRAIEMQIKIAAPAKEKKLFLNAEQFWESKSYYDIYNFKPTFFVSTFNIPLERTLREGDELNWKGYHFKIIETGGHTIGSISYLVELDGKMMAFTGDLIHSGGKTLTYYDLEYIYDDNGEGGISGSLTSFKKLLSHKPSMLLPSHGSIITKPAEEIKSLKQKLQRAREAFYSQHSSILEEINLTLNRKIKPINLEREFPHVLHDGFKPPYILIGSDHNCILIDFSGSSYFGYRLEELQEIFTKHGIERIDFIIPTHYHDDHVAGIPLLQKIFHTNVYALENMVDILENPTDYRMGCLIEQSIKVDKILKEGDILKWDKYEFQIFHFPGQTEYHAGLFGKIDGKSVFFTGDSIIANTFDDKNTNLNGLNLCKLGENVGYMRCADILLQYNPEYLAISHYGIIPVNEALLKQYKKIVSEYEPIITDIVAQENPNMGLDPNWICFKPIRIIAKNHGQVNTNLQVRNYLNKYSTVKFKLNLPLYWKASYETGEIRLSPGEIKRIPVRIFIPDIDKSLGRSMITANVLFNNKKLGPMADLMIDYNYHPSKTWRGWTYEAKKDLLPWIIHQIRVGYKYFS